MIISFLQIENKQMTQRLPSLAINNTKIMEKSFVFNSSDEYIRQILLQQGWLQLPKESNAWQLKWTWKCHQKDFSKLQPKQMINHFRDSTRITTKMGLTLTLKTNIIISNKGHDYSYFYPRSYSLNSDKNQFVKDFIETGILNLLKKIIISLQVFYPQQYQRVKEFRKSKKIQNPIKYLEWLLSSNQNWFTKKADKNIDLLQINGKILLNLLCYLQNKLQIDSYYNIDDKILKQLYEYGKNDPPFKETDKKFKLYPTLQCLHLLFFYYDKCQKQIKNFEQDGLSNIWMIKSNYSSRGRNITLIDNLNDAKSQDNGMKVIQKYIQNIWILHEISQNKLKQFPFLHKIYKKKFDIRIWVFVKSYSPLSVYVFEQGYLRISSSFYRLDTVSAHSHFSHLTNYSVNWKSKTTPQEESYALLSQFYSYLKAYEEVDIQKLKQKIDEIIQITIRSAQLQSDKECFELFGFDILLDSKFKPWLIECNMSPSCAERGQLKQISRKMGSGLLNLLGITKGSENSKKWRMLISQKAQIKLSENERKKVFQASMMHFYQQISLFGQKISCKKYLQNQKHKIKLQKILFLQHFMKMRYKVQKKRKNKCVLCGPYLKFMQVFAKVAKKNKKYWFCRMKKRIISMKS